MADIRALILHHYDASPFAEKVRLALRLKNLAWHSVDAPVIMPKPDLIALTGGYRRIPVMQIGADIYCDTSMILREVDRRYQLPLLTLPGHEGLASMVAAWTDGKWFQSSVGVIFGALGDKVDEAFVKDREALTGRPFDPAAMKAAAPVLKAQWLAQLLWIEDRLSGGNGAGAGNYIISTKPGLVDVHAFMNVWFVHQSAPDFVNECFERAPRTKAWFERLKDTGGQEPIKMPAQDALDIAKQAGPRLLMASGRDLGGLNPGQEVEVAPDDYGQDWVAGTLVHTDGRSIIISRTTEELGTLNIHFPRAGYIVKPA
ncbi:MAG: glutathione S-transferase [Hyphomonadaceae bacterium]